LAKKISRKKNGEVSMSPRPNDQARAPDAIRLRSSQISYGREQWDFDLDTALAPLLPARCLDCGNIARSGERYDDYAAGITARARPTCGDRALSCACSAAITA
jgi:agmatinase